METDCPGKNPFSNTEPGAVATGCYDQLGTGAGLVVMPVDPGIPSLSLRVLYLISNTTSGLHRIERPDTLIKQQDVNRKRIGFHLSNLVLNYFSEVSDVG